MWFRGRNKAQKSDRKTKMAAIFACHFLKNFRRFDIFTSSTWSIKLKIQPKKLHIVLNVVYIVKSVLNGYFLPKIWLFAGQFFDSSVSNFAGVLWMPFRANFFFKSTIGQQFCTKYLVLGVLYSFLHFVTKVSSFLKSTEWKHFVPKSPAKIQYGRHQKHKISGKVHCNSLCLVKQLSYGGLSNLLSQQY